MWVIWNGLIVFDDIFCKLTDFWLKISSTWFVQRMNQKEQTQTKSSYPDSSVLKEMNLHRKVTQKKEKWGLFQSIKKCC